jgi:transcriptional regulator with XRE-family HTH domain
VKSPIRLFREKKGISMRDVERACILISEQMAKKGDKDAAKYRMQRSRLIQIEKTGSMPGPHKVAALARVYKVSTAHILKLLSPIDLLPPEEKASE